MVGRCAHSQVTSQQGKLVKETLKMIGKMELLMYLLQFEKCLLKFQGAKQHFLFFLFFPLTLRCFALQIKMSADHSMEFRGNFYGYLHSFVGKS